MKCKAHTIPRADWNEIAMLPAVQNAFQSEHMWGSDLAELVYGARFILSSYKDSDDEIILYTLVRTFNDKEVVVVLERNNKSYSIIRKGKVSLLKSKY
jgi:hypothetical protein